MNERIFVRIVLVLALVLVVLPQTLSADLSARESPLEDSTWCSPVIVDSEGSVGRFASLAVINGRPAIAYYDETNGDLMYVRAGDPYGVTWGDPAAVDTAGDVGWYTSLSVVNGHPTIAYYDYTNHRVKYVRANDLDGAAWGSPVIVANAANKLEIAGYPSLAVVEGHPAIAYYFAWPFYNQRYVRANDPNGATWGSPVSLDGGGTGNHSSLKVVDGHPAVAYYKWTSDDLKYVRANDSTGASWGAPITVDAPGDVGWYASLAVVDGHPAIGYFDWLPHSDLKYVRANDSTGASWSSPVTVDSAGDVGRFGSMAIVDGRPALTYYDETNDVLKYVRAGDDAGTSWDTPIAVDSVSVAGVLKFDRLASLADVNGSPAIAYYDAVNANLKYVSAVCIIEVPIDIKPGSDPNSINPKSKGKIPVAILSTPDFASSKVDQDSLTFGRNGDEESLAFCNPGPEDVNADGYDDLVCHFYTQSTAFECGDEWGYLKGQTVDGIPIEGSDSVRIVPCKK